MQDILFKKKEPIPPSVPLVPKPGNRSLTTILEGTLSLTSQVGSWLKRVGDSSTQPEVLAYPAAPAPALVKPRKNHRAAAKKNLTATAEKLHQTGRRAATSLKTPIGRLATVQALAIAALFIYVNHHHFVASQGGVNSVQSVKADEKISRYLPNVSDYQAPKPFQQSAAAVVAGTSFYAWVTPWNSSDLAQNSSTYASVSAFWLDLNPDAIGVTPKQDWKAWQDYRTSSKNSKQTYYLTVSGDPNTVYLLLTDPATQRKHIDALLKVVQDQGFDGIDIDYEGLGAENRDLFSEFTRNLTSQFHAAGKRVSITVEARIANRQPMDWHALSQIADELRIMAYNYHSRQTNTPGPISPLGWLKEILDYTSQNVDSSKLVIGLGNYGYDWQKPDQDGQPWQGTGISFDQAMAIAQQKNIPIVRANGIDDRGYDMGSIPTFTYQDPNGHQHAVWFEDNASLQAKLTLISQYRTKAVIFWSVGLGDQKFWQSSQQAIQ